MAKKLPQYKDVEITDGMVGRQLKALREFGYRKLTEAQLREAIEDVLTGRHVTPTVVHVIVRKDIDDALEDTGHSHE